MLEAFKRTVGIIIVKTHFRFFFAPEKLAALDKKSTIEKGAYTTFCFLNFLGNRFVGHYVHDDRRIEATLYFEDRNKIIKIANKKKYDFN